MKSILWKSAALLPLVLSLGAGCPLIPDLEEKVVELAVGGSTIVAFESEGALNFHYDTKTIDIADSLDIEGILDDAGVDVDSVQSVKLANVSYRVTRQDPEPTRRIENGNVWIRRGSSPDSTLLVSNFSEDVNSVTNFKPAPLNAAGVAVVNDILADILADVQAGITPSESITYIVTGISTPGAVPTDFAWELKVDVTIVGTVKVEVPS